MLEHFPIHATVAAADIDRARAWYESHLGIQPRLEEDGLWYEFASGTWLHVYATASAGTAQNTQAGWTVDDLEAVMAGLRSRGVVFEEYDFGEGFRTVNGVLTVGHAKASWFKDSEGNTFEISEVDRPARPGSDG